MKIKLFYGWYIVILALVVAAYYSAFFVYGWTAFVNPIITSFGWSMTQLSLASSLRSLETGIFNPIWGTAVDRWSPRKLMLLGLTGTALGIFFLSQTRNLAMYYAGFLIMGLGSSLVTNILPVAMISRWFKRDIGKANGLFYMGLAIGGVSIPLVVRTIDVLGWQTTLLYAAIGLLVMGMPLAFVYRSRPQDYGLLPDGKPLDGRKGTEPTRSSEFGASVGQALKTRAFWYLGIVNLCDLIGYSAASFYMIPYLTSLGISRASASTVVSLYALVCLFSRVPMGALSDIFRKSYVVALSVALKAVGFFLLWLIDGTSPFWLILLFSIIFGMAVGGASPLRAPILTEYFGTRNFGAIFGVSSLFMTVGSIVSPPLVGWVFDTYNDYKVSWLAATAFQVLALVLILTIPRPKGRPNGSPAGQAPAISGEKLAAR